MANNITLIITDNTTTYAPLNFTITCAAIGYSKTISKVFVPGIPATVNQVRIGATETITLSNLFANLVANDLDGNVSFVMEFPKINFVFNTVQTYIFDLISDAYAFDMLPEFMDELPVEINVLQNFDIQDLAIEIIDTYVNERILIEELTQQSAPQLSFDAGDDLLSNIMVSKLSFNMYVADKADAKFKHLFTSDENRFLVKLSSVSPTDEFTLVWQGFLLPDDYSEPYVTGPFFVNFTATDLLGTLKGKFFPHWYYNNVFPISELLAEIFKTTGLEQNAVVKPSIIPSNPLLTWRDINVPLMPYYDGKKYTNLFEILSDVLKANLLFLVSYKGFWMLEGLTRRKDIEGEVIQFNSNGKLIEPSVFEKIVVQPMLSDQTTQVISVSPYKSVNVVFDANGDKNLFSDNVIKINPKDIYFSYYRSRGFTGTVPITVPNNHYTNIEFNSWINTLGDQFVYRRSNYLGNIVGRAGSYGDTNYNMTEAAALLRYLECPEKPFVKPGVLYSIQMEFTAIGVAYVFDVPAVLEKLKNNELDKMFPFQIFVNNVERFSNRPSFESVNKYIYEVSDRAINSYFHEFTFKLEFEFRVEQQGYLVFRNLAPILDYANDGNLNFISLTGEVLKLSTVEDYEYNENVIAIRDVNYTQVLEYDTKLNSSIDTSIKNTMGLGFPINTNYFIPIDRTVAPSNFTDVHLFAPTTALEIQLGTWQISNTLFLFLFVANAKNAVFLEKSTGERIRFTSLYWSVVSNMYRLGYLKDYEGYPYIPKDYKKYTDLEATDLLKVMIIIYLTEAIERRLDWNVFGSLNTDLFNKTLAKAIHCVYPEALYRIEGTALALIFPDNLIQFFFDAELRNFIPTTLTLDLFNGKTTFVATEAKFSELTDISYE